MMGFYIFPSVNDIVHGDTYYPQYFSYAVVDKII
jgi:hypothetical protein